jgi:hypothetical protein
MYCASDFITGKEALQILGLNPKKTEYLKWLYDRGLLNRHKVNRKVVKYPKKEVQQLFHKHIAEGVLLTVKPLKSC